MKVLFIITIDFGQVRYAVTKEYVNASKSTLDLISKFYKFIYLFDTALYIGKNGLKALREGTYLFCRIFS